MPEPRERKSLLFVIHGTRADQPALRHLVSWVRDKGHTVDPRITWEPGDAERFAREGASRGVDAIVALGGDGTVNDVGNARVTGGGTRVTPRAHVDDGLLDVCIVEARPRTDFARLLLRVRRGEHLGEPGVHYAQLPRLEVASRRPIMVNADGEPSTGRHFTYVALPRELLVHLPRLP